MKKMIKKFGKLITASFIVMGIGLVTFLSTPIWLQFGIDTDIPGFFIILIGLEIYIIGLICRKNLGRAKLAALITLVSILSIAILSFVVGLIFPDFNFH
ncbi:MAG: hypothetical protein ABSD79_03910 [Dehalococcoidales bacterium]|jgi:hypothetical protein